MGNASPFKPVAAAEGSQPAHSSERLNRQRGERLTEAGRRKGSRTRGLQKLLSRASTHAVHVRVNMAISSSLFSICPQISSRRSCRGDSGFFIFLVPSWLRHKFKAKLKGSIQLSQLQFWRCKRLQLRTPDAFRVVIK